MNTTDDNFTFFLEAFEPANRADPYPLYARKRSEGAVHADGAHVWVAFGHEDCQRVIRSPQASSDERHGTLFRREMEHDPRLREWAATTPSLVFLDPPDHTRIRSMVAAAFTPRRVEHLRARIETITDELLDALAERAGDGEVVDLVESFAYPIPVAVICELLGVPVADQSSFRGWSQALTKSVDPSVLRTPEEQEAIDVADVELAAYTADLLERRRHDPGDDLLSALITDGGDDDRLTADELVSLVSLLLIAGHETTVNLIGNGMVALLDHPDELCRWRADPALAPAAVDELLRFDSPVQMVQRIALEPMTVGEVDLAAGDQVVALLGSANRDPAVFAEPDRLDLGRPNAARHIAFGGGIHHCLGAALARTEGQIAVTRLLQRFGTIERAGPAELRPTFTLRGRKTLPVSLGTS